MRNSRLRELVHLVMGVLVLHGRSSSVPIQGLLTLELPDTHRLQLVVLHFKQQGRNPHLRSHLKVIKQGTLPTSRKQTLFMA